MRIYVERQSGFNTRGDCVKKESIDFLKLTGLEKVRAITGFDVEGLEQDKLTQLQYTVFADEKVDKITQSIDDIGEGYVFATRYLEHQYDQKADSCIEMINLIYPNANVKVKVTEILIFYGDLAGQEDKITEYFLNPLEAYKVELSSQVNFGYGKKQPEPVPVIKGFSNFDHKDLDEMKAKYEITLSYEDLEYCQDYYKKEDKDPTVTELKILDTYWSDHCRHSTFLTVLEDIQVKDSLYKEALENAEKRFKKAVDTVYDYPRPTCLMDIGTMEMKRQKKLGILTDLEKSDEINACSIEVPAKVDGEDRDFVIMFKNETHNHPTEMEPFGGAGTCIGGGIRDPLSGRSHVYGSIRVTGSADPREAFEDTMEGKLPQRKITKVAADGYSDYGNQIGVAAGHLQEYYHPGFKAKRLECGALVAYNFKENIIRENGSSGDVIVMLGGKTGRDGLGGATGSSQEQVGDTEDYSAEVQKGNPPVQRSIMRLFRKPEISKLIKKSNDFGAGGVSVAIGELADSLVIHLDRVPLKYPDLNATEIAISESQERMAVLLDKAHVDQFINAAQAENLTAVAVADVTDDGYVVLEYKGDVVCQLKSEFLNSAGVRQKADVVVTPPQFNEEPTIDEDLKNKWLNNLSALNVSSKKNLANQFDKTVGGQTTFFPFGGKNMETPEQGLAMGIPLLEGETDLATIMTVGYDPELCDQSPFHSAYYAVLESVMKAVSMGGELKRIRLSFQEYFERMDSPESWGKAYSALMGGFLAQNQLEVPSIGGKDSMSGSYQDLNVPPTLISFAVAPVDKNKLVSKSFKNIGNYVYLLETPVTKEGLPEKVALKGNIELLMAMVNRGQALSTSVVGAGGIAGEISAMCFGNNIGFKFSEDFTSDLFKPAYQNVIIESKEELPLQLIGRTSAEKSIRINDMVLSLEESLVAYKGTLKEVYNYEEHPAYTYQESGKTIQVKATTKENPKAVVPIFYGTNGEYSLIKQLNKSGITTEEIVFRNKFPEDSYNQLGKAIDNCNILAIPSGMTGGAKPECSGKMIAIILSNPVVGEAVNKLIDRGGLVIGLGEGFNALVSVGLIQHGKVKTKTDSLSITRNPLNTHYSGLLETAIINSVEPFYKGITKEVLPVSALDGRIVMDNKDFQKYLEAGQIVSVFSESNPFGGYGIEAMVSPNGQVLGMLGDISQLDKGLYANVFNAEQSPVFNNIKEFFQE